METSRATPRYPEACHAPDPRGLILAVYMSTMLWIGLGYAIRALG